MSAKSLWNWITNRAAAGTPDNLSLFPFAPQPGTSLVTQAKHCTAADIIGGGGGAVDIGLRRKTLTFTDAQIKNLPTAPVQVEAGQPGKYITVLQAIYVMDTRAAAYTNVNPGGGFATLGFGVAGTSFPFLGAMLISDEPGFTNSTSFTSFFTNNDLNVWSVLGSYMQVIGLTTLGVFTGADMEPQKGDSGAPEIGADLSLICSNNGNTAFTGGDAANSLRIEVLYWIA